MQQIYLTFIYIVKPIKVLTELLEFMSFYHFLKQETLQNQKETLTKQHKEAMAIFKKQVISKGQTHTVV